MGAFDDLIPDAKTAAGAFDDLIPSATAARGAFNDLLPSEPPNSDDYDANLAWTQAAFPHLSKRDQVAMTADRLRRRIPDNPTAGEAFLDTLGELRGEVVKGAARNLVIAPGRTVARVADQFLQPSDVVGPVKHQPNALERAVTAADETLETAFPAPAMPGLEHGVAQGVGQVGSMLGTGGLLRAMGAGPKLLTGAVIGQGAVGEFDDAFNRAIERGDDADTAFAKSLGYSTVAGLIENKLGAGRILRQMYPTAEAAAKKLTALGVSKAVAGNVLAGGFEEGLQRTAQNLIVDEKPSLEGVLEEAIPGAIVQGAAGLPASVTQAVEQGQQFDQEQAYDQALEAAANRRALEATIPKGAPVLTPRQTTVAGAFDDLIPSEAQPPKSETEDPNSRPAEAVATPAPPDASQQSQVRKELEALPGANQDLMRKVPALTTEQTDAGLNEAEAPATKADLEALANFIQNGGPNPFAKPADQSTTENTETQSKPANEPNSDEDNADPIVMAAVKYSNGEVFASGSSHALVDYDAQLTFNERKAQDPNYKTPTAISKGYVRKSGKYTSSEETTEVTDSAQVSKIPETQEWEVQKRIRKENPVTPETSSSVTPEAVDKTAPPAKPAAKASQEFDRLVKDYGPQAGWATGDEGVYNPQLAGSENLASGIAAKVEVSRQMQALRRRALSYAVPAEQRGNYDLETPEGRAKALPVLEAWIRQQFPGDNTIAKRRALQQFSASEPQAPTSVEQRARVKADEQALRRIAAQNPGESLLQGLTRSEPSRPAGVRAKLPRTAERGGTVGALGNAAQGKAIRELERIFGVHIIFVSQPDGQFGFNGWKDSRSNVILINTASPVNALTIAGHELSHHLMQAHPGVFADLYDALMPLVGAEQFAAFQQRFQLRGQGTSAEVAKLELIGDFMGDNMARPEFWNNLRQREPDLFKRLARIVKSWLDKLIAKVNGAGQGAKGYDSEQYFTDLEQARDVVTNALIQAGRETQYRAAGIVENEEGGMQNKEVEGEFSKPAQRVPERFELKTPITGPTGAKILGYEWRSTMGEKYSEREGGYVDARVSDWDNADESTGTGRAIVHVYYVQHPDGTVKPEGIKSAQNVLGISETRLQSIAKKERAAQQYQQDQERAEMHIYAKAASQSPQDAARDYRKTNYSPMRSFEENNEVFNESALFEQNGKFIRRSWKATERMQRNGWTLVTDDPARTLGTAKAIEATRAAEPQSQTESGLPKELTDAVAEWRKAEKRLRRAYRQEPTDIADAQEAREEAEIDFRALAEKHNITQEQFDALRAEAKATDTETMAEAEAEQGSLFSKPEKPLLELTRDQFDRKYSIHFDVRDGAAERVESIMRDGLRSGMVSSDIDNRTPEDIYAKHAMARGWARFAGVDKPGAIAYVIRNSDLRGKTIYVKPGTKPVAVVRLTRENQSVYEALQEQGATLFSKPEKTNEPIDAKALAAHIEPTARLYATPAKEVAEILEKGNRPYQQEFGIVDPLFAGKASSPKFGGPDGGQQPQGASGPDGGLSRKAHSLRTHKAADFQADFARGPLISSINPDKVSSQAIPTYNVNGQVIASPADFARTLLAVRSPYNETLKVVILDNNNVVQHSETLYAGSLDGLYADSRDLLRLFEKHSARGRRMMISHNHPSGVVTPSAADIKVTANVQRAAKAAGFEIVDHVITNGDEFYSFASQQVMPLDGSPLADWEVLPRKALQHTTIDDNQKLAALVKELRQGNNAFAHVIYLNTRSHVTAIERIHGGEGNFSQRVVRGISREGAMSVLIDFGPTVSPQPAASMVRTINAETGGSTRVVDFAAQGTMSGRWDGYISETAGNQLKDDLFGAPESVEEQRARLKREAEGQKLKKAKEAMQERAAARLTGQDIDTTQEMFGAPEGRSTRQDKAGQGSLFSKPEGNADMARLQNEIAAAEKELMEAIRLTTLPADMRTMSKKDALAAKDEAAAKLRRLMAEQLKLMTSANVDAARSPEQTAEMIGQTVDMLNSIQDEISERTAKSQEIPADLTKLRQDLQTRLNLLKGWTDDQTDEAAQNVQGPKSKVQSSEARGRFTELESATDPERQTWGEWWQKLKLGLRYLTSPIPELPLTGENARKSALFRRGYRLFAVENDRVQKEAADKVNHVLEPFIKLGRNPQDNAAMKEYFRLGEALQRAKMDPAKTKLIQERMAKLEERLNRDPFQLFRRLVLYRDLWWRGTYLKTEDSKPITLPMGLTVDEVQGQLSKLTAAIAQHKDGLAITEALRRHYALTDELQKSILAHGEIIPESLRNPLYFPHHMIDSWTGRIDRVRASTEEDFRRYLIAPQGSGKLIQTDYLKSMYLHTASVLAHNARVDLVQKYWQPYDISDQLKAQHGAAWNKPWNIPPGYKLFTPFRKLPLRMDYVLSREVLADKLGVLFNDGDLRERLGEAGRVLKVKPEDLHAAMVAGEKIQWALPEEIADALNGIARREAAASNPGLGHAIGLPFRKLNSFWKGTKLFAPWNWIRYEYGNLSTDAIDKVLAADPGAAKYLARAAREVWNSDTGEQTPEFKAAQREGVFDTVTAGEAGDLMKLPAFKEFLTPGEKKLETVKRILGGPARGSKFREATFRYANFLANLERLRAGQEPVYAGAFHGDIEALGEDVDMQRRMLDGEELNYAKAAEISLKTFGDYNSLGVAGQWLRQYAVPFWSWQDVNFRYHANQLRNLADGLAGDPQQVNTARKAALRYAGVRVVSTLIAVGIAKELWNQFGGPALGIWDDDDDLEAKLSEQDRRRGHILLGKDDKGQAMVVYTPSAWSDVAEWIGGQNAKRLFMEWARGQITLEQFISDYAKQLPRDVVNKGAGSLGPLIKGFYEAASGKSTFPDVLDQRNIPPADKWYRFLGNMTDDRIVNTLRGAFDEDYYSQPALEQLQQIILQVRRRDPEQWSYYEAREDASDWKETKTGKRSEFGSYDAPEAQALRNFRKAIYRGDVANAERFYNRLIAFGYTAERLDASIRNQHPLADLNEAERKEYLQTLTPKQRQELELATKYYNRIKALDGRERQLFPRKGQKPNPKPELLKRIVEDQSRNK